MQERKFLQELNIMEIIERKIQFIRTNNIFKKADFKEYDEGQISAFQEILIDIKSMTELDFTSKYLEIVKHIGNQFEDELIKDESEIEKLSGYNNAIVSVLELVNPIFLYDLETIDN